MDCALRENVSNALAWNAAIDSSKLTVSVKDGLVVLRGEVRQYSDKLEARRTAQNVAGARGVIVMIDVVPEDASSDSDIARAVIMALSLGSELPGDLVTVKVENGWVSLSGAVAWNYQRQNAVNAVCFLPGVKGFIDNMTLRSADDRHNYCAADGSRRQRTAGDR